MEKLTLEPTLHIRFTNDFTAVQVEGDLEDPSSFGLTLMTAMRSLSTGAMSLSLGDIKSIRGLGANEGFQIMFDDSGRNLKKFAHVTQWSDMESAHVAAANYYPVIPATSDITGWLEQLPSIRWLGLRSQSEESWTHQFRDETLDEAAVSSFSLSILQVDFLIRSLNLPRRQMQINFTGNTLWMAVNEDSDFLLVLSNSSLSSGARATLERCLSFFTWPL